MTRVRSHVNPREDKKLSILEDLPPPPWGACISCTPLTTSSLRASQRFVWVCACVRVCVSQCQSSHRANFPLSSDGMWLMSADTSAQRNGCISWLWNTLRVTVDFLHRNQQTVSLKENVRAEMSSTQDCPLLLQPRVKSHVNSDKEPEIVRLAASKYFFLLVYTPYAVISPMARLVATRTIMGY